MANAKKPNILVIFGDDIGMWNLSCYSSGMMGYQTPNIDRIAREGMRFTDLYGEQSCTAGRAAFATGQSVFRTGLSKVGMPGAEIGLGWHHLDRRGQRLTWHNGMTGGYTAVIAVNAAHQTGAVALANTGGAPPSPLDAIVFDALSGP